MKKNIEPLISILIVCLIFSASVFVIFEAEKIFYKELSASVYKPIISKPRTEIGGLLTDKAKEQLGRMIFSNCSEKTSQDFEEAWNQECKKLGAEDRCSLPRYIADQLTTEYQEAKNNCY